jgi:hypothetical protein
MVAIQYRPTDVFAVGVRRLQVFQQYEWHQATGVKEEKSDYDFVDNTYD